MNYYTTDEAAQALETATFEPKEAEDPNKLPPIKQKTSKIKKEK
jgi:hypothetical protein